MTTHYSKESMILALQKNLNQDLGHYGLVDRWLRHAFEKHPLLGQDILIYGSCEQGFGPWYEMMCLSHGASVFITDYNEPIYETNARNLVAFLKQPIDPRSWMFKNILSISTFEHSGLGRYGDSIDPNGDLKAMEEARSLITDGGKLFLAVPLGIDKTVGNLHRIYGSDRLPKLLKGWKMIDSFGYEKEYLHRDTGDGWNPKDSEGFLIHPEYPEYCPILVLQKE